MDIKERYDYLVSKRSELEKDLIQLQTKKQVCEDNINENLKKLTEDFGVDNIEDAKKKADEMKSMIESVLDKCERALKNREELS